jgi:hypothetical protein
VAAFINSPAANEIIKPFQAAGLFGPRHVNKKILDVPLPKFAANNAQHVALSALSAVCAEKAAAYVAAEVPYGSEYTIGKVRTAIKKLLAAELAAIDVLLNEIVAASADAPR